MSVSSLINQVPVRGREEAEALSEEHQKAIKNVGVATAGAPGDIENLVVALSKMKQGMPPQLAFGARDGVLPTSEEVAESTGTEENLLYQLFGLDPLGPAGKVMGAAAPLLLTAIKKGDYDTFVKTVKAFKLFREKDGDLFPLYVNAKEAVEEGKWLKAKPGPTDPKTGQVESSIGKLANRPGWHAGDTPSASHIGGTRSSLPEDIPQELFNPELKKNRPVYRPDDQVWAEVEMADDVDWQSVANANAQLTKSGKPIARTAQVTDQVPEGGHYRYKTNPNMEGEWLIGGDMKVGKRLSPEDVSKANLEAGGGDLPTLAELREVVAGKVDPRTRGWRQDIFNQDWQPSRRPSLPSIWEGVGPDAAREIARREAHLRQGKDGQFIGAPRGTESLADVMAHRQKADEMVEGGAHGMGWYDDARREARELAPNDPNLQTLFGRGGAAYSPQAMPDTELGFFLKQHNAKVLEGVDKQARTEGAKNAVKKAYSERADKGFDIEPYKLELGEKTGPYADARDPQIPAEDLYKTANDIWHGRVMGYGDDFDRGFNPQEHAYLTGENLLLAERAAARDAEKGITREADWDPRAAQAATWVAKREEDYISEMTAAAEKKIKADAEFNAKKREQNAEIDRQNVEREKNGQTPLKHKKLREEKSLEERLPEIKKQAREKATKGIPEAVDRHSAYITSEARTGKNVDHLWMEDPEEIQDYTDMVRAIAERDPVVDPLQMFSKDAKPTVGEYINSAGEVERNPGFQHQVLVSSDLADSPQMTPTDASVLDMSALLGGIMRAQEAGAWSRFMPEGMGKQKAADMNAMMVAHPGQGPDALTGPAAEAGASVINYGDRSAVTKFGDEGPVPGTTLELRDALAGVPNSTARRGTLESGYEPTLLDTPPGEGAATQNLLDRSEELGKTVRNFEGRTADAVADQARAMNALDSEIAKSTGKKVREDLMKLREILGTGGLPALREHVKNFGTKGLPAVVLGALGLQAAGQTRTGDASPRGA